ncbi:MAG: SAM-dependent methyltransferase [Sphingomonadales bacterium]|nr:SAM-dependent methyltransferase [Sphingomonadales bacterium]
MSNSPADRDAPPLLGRLRERIASHGPLRVDQYMQACLDDPQDGYWQRAATIGAGGDFITAPEISQVFGELIGLWSVVVWQGMGRPSPLRLVELGPGRGTLMRDALRAVQAVPRFFDAATVHLIEASEPLRAVQEQTLARHRNAVTWHRAMNDVPPGAAIVIANEFLDALPIRQLVCGGDVWHERVVDLAPPGGLRFVAGLPVEPPSGMEAKLGAIVELRAGEGDLLAALAARINPHVALFIDYGPADLSFGDTLQAVRRHAYADPLAEPGMADLTAHVQFAALAQKARAAGLAAHGPITQAEFLGRLGIVERAQRLMAANPGRAGEIEAAVQRLISPGGMGGPFKVMSLGSPHLPPPPPFG